MHREQAPLVVLVENSAPAHTHTHTHTERERESKRCAGIYTWCNTGNIGNINVYNSKYSNMYKLSNIWYTVWRSRQWCPYMAVLTMWCLTRRRSRRTRYTVLYSSSSSLKGSFWITTGRTCSESGCRDVMWLMGPACTEIKWSPAHLIKRYSLGFCCNHSAHSGNDVVNTPPILLFIHSSK